MGITEQFLALVDRREDAVSLDVASILIAAHANPDVDSVAVLDHLDALAAGCPGDSLEELRFHLFSTVGLAGNRRHYDDPRNSLLDQVLERRLGIPITLSVVMLEVGRRLGLALYGVGMPGHFLVGAGGGRFVDPFEGGRLLDRAGCRAQFHSVVGADAPWDDSFLGPVGSHAILARILANLRQLYAAAGDLESLAWVLRLRAGIPGADHDRLQLASVLSALGRYDEAARAVDELAAMAPPSDAEPLRDRAMRLRARLN